MQANSSSLISIPPDRIRPNPDNPRMIFREAEMNQLLESIRAVGIQVPLTLYEDNGEYILIDGERRWRCATRLNHGSVPAIVQPKPGRLENILMMFNIHNVRLDWDLMPMAMKLAEVRSLLEASGKPAKPKDLSGITGVSLPTVRRALELLELPEHYRTMLLREAEKPSDQRKITVDLFVEVNKSRRVLESYVPEVFENISENDYVDAMVRKYESGVVNNVVKFREISKIARAERAGGDSDAVVPALIQLVANPEYRIEDAYQDTVQAAYEARDILGRARGLTERLFSIPAGRRLSREIQDELRRLREQIGKLLGD